MTSAIPLRPSPPPDGHGAVVKLYTSPNSPFGARVAIAASAKRIGLEQAALPAGGLRSAEFLALNPIAKIPVLVLDDGTVLPESETILRYLEVRFPEPSLYPPGDAEKALVDRAVRLMDHYVMAPVIRLFPQLDPTRRDAQAMDSEVAQWRTGLAALAHFLRDPLPDAPAGVSLADCVLAPSFHLGTRIAAMLGLADDPMATHECLVAYYRRMAGHPLVGPVLKGLTDAQEKTDLHAGLPSLAARHRAAAHSDPSSSATKVAKA